MAVLVLLAISGWVVGAVAGTLVVEGLEEAAISDTPGEAGWSKSALAVAQTVVLSLLFLGVAAAAGVSFWRHRLRAGSFLGAVLVALPVGLLFA